MRAGSQFLWVASSWSRFQGIRDAVITFSLPFLGGGGAFFIVGPLGGLGQSFTLGFALCGPSPPIISLEHESSEC